MSLKFIPLLPYRKFRSHDTPTANQHYRHCIYVAATGTTPHTATLVNPICAKRFSQALKRATGTIEDHYRNIRCTPSL